MQGGGGGGGGGGGRPTAAELINRTARIRACAGSSTKARRSETEQSASP